MVLGSMKLMGSRWTWESYCELQDDTKVLDDPRRCVALVIVHNIRTAADPQCLRRGSVLVNGEWYCRQHYRIKFGE